ncbi:hypothetical protein [Cochleicola gelatinilyticus]|uniref:Uncharacterized protein n=1 Tax=Cochleicola gelatinilyticus TaxID=1763537 RepID=A0A167HNR1_9FLAO|nr:hypothetical protein [Cochleicola gelatinilyticus]OAB78804.1 hypothetical protein ULVI_09495 [Cochleicola gelatinilyticus]
MIDIKTVFEKEMYFKELGGSRKHGVQIIIPKMVLKPPQKISFSTIEHLNGITIPDALESVYNQTNNMVILWHLDKNNSETIKKFQEDPWILKNMIPEGYEWSVIHEWLSGFINLTPSEDIFNLEFLKKQSFYYTLQSMPENEEDFFPLDITWNLTACLRKVNNSIEDEIWLVDSDAQKIYSMNMTIKAYLQEAYRLKCIHHWQLASLFPKQSLASKLIENMLPKLLPHIAFKNPML